MLHRMLMILAGGTLVGAAAGTAVLDAPAAEIRITSSPNTAVRIVAPASASVSVAAAPVTVHGDTLLVRTPVRFTASLATGDLRIESVDTVSVDVEALLSSGPTMRLAGSGRALILKAGGREIQVPR